MDGTIEHFSLGIVAWLISRWLHRTPWPAIWAFFMVELTQWEAFRWDYIRFWFDGLHDLVMDFIGAGIGNLIYYIIIERFGGKQAGDSTRSFE